MRLTVVGKFRIQPTPISGGPSGEFAHEVLRDTSIVSLNAWRKLWLTRIHVEFTSGGRLYGAIKSRGRLIAGSLVKGLPAFHLHASKNKKGDVMTSPWGERFESATIPTKLTGRVSDAFFGGSANHIGVDVNRDRAANRLLKLRIRKGFGNRSDDHFL